MYSSALFTNKIWEQCLQNIVRMLLSMSLDSILVSSLVSVSGPYTELHECVYLHVHILAQKCIIYQQMVGICCEILTFYCCTKYYFSLSIRELQEHASSHCSSLWYTKGIVYQQNYHKIGAKSLNKFCACMYSGY